MKIYGRTTSFNVQKVMWLAEELALDYEHIELGGRFGGLDNEDFALLNPMRKVPVLIDGERSVWESHTILRYLIATYGNSHWYPTCAYQRSQYERWSDWSQATFQPAFMGVFWGYYRRPPHKRNLESITSHLKQCYSCLEIVEQQLSLSKATFLAGRVITIADICVGAILYRLTEQGLDVVLPPNVERWYQALKQRQGYNKWVMSDFSELQSREDF